MNKNWKNIAASFYPKSSTRINTLYNSNKAF